MKTRPYLFQRQDVRRIRRFRIPGELVGIATKEVNRVLVANPMGCLHPHSVLKCYQTGETKTAEGWFSASAPPWLPTYTKEGGIRCQQASELIQKPNMDYIRVVLSNGKETTVGADHVFLARKNGRPVLIPARSLAVSDDLTILSVGISGLENTTGTSTTSAESIPNKKPTGSDSSWETGPCIDRDWTASNSNYPWRKRTLTIWNNLPVTLNSPALRSTSSKVAVPPGSSICSALVSAPTWPNWEWACKRNGIEQYPPCPPNWNVIFGEGCSTPTAPSPATTRMISPSPFATPPNPSWMDFDWPWSKTASANQPYSGETLLGKYPPVEEAPLNGGLIGYTKTLPDFWLERPPSSEGLGIAESLEKDHFIPASFQNLNWTPIRQIECVGRGPVFDLTMEGTGNYFDAAGINHQNTGKSLEALTCICDWGLTPAVIVCPASVKWNWAHEAMVHVGLRAEVLESMTAPQGRILKPPQIVVINYDILRAWLSYLRKLKPLCIVLDEAHFLQSRTTQRTKNVRALCRRIPNVLALSGTPLINRPAELWPTLNILRPDLFNSWPEFARRHCDPQWKPWGWQYKGATDLDVLHRRLTKHLMIRRPKSEALPGLPAKRRVVVPLDMRGRKQYEHAVKDFLGWMAKHHKHKLGTAAKAERLVQLGYLKRLAASLKVHSVMAWVDDFLATAEGKLILFAIHKKIIRKLYDRYRGLSVVVTGEVTGRKRQAAVDAFQKNPKIRLFIGNLDAAGVGWNGTAAEAVAFAELGWSPGRHVQGEDRLHRIGQTRKTVAYYLVAKDSIESDIVELLQKKQKTLDTVLDGGNISKEDQWNLIEQLANIYKGRI